MTKEVHFLANREQITNYALAPVRKNLRNLHERGINIKIFYRITESLTDCDVLCLLSKPTHSHLHEQGPVYSDNGPLISFIKRARETVDRIIWMDDSDSTSVTHFELLPYVDRYLKKQLLIDRSRYEKPLYGGRIFSDYYHRTYGITDSTPFDQFYPLNKKYHDKVSVSWNIGLGDMSNAFTWKSVFQKYFPDWILPDYDIRYFSPNGNRPVHIFLRTSANFSRESVVYQRRKMLEKLADILEANPAISGMAGNKISSSTSADRAVLPEVPRRLSGSEYRNIMAHTLLAPSPFGWGEIGARDYEAFIYGCTLLKPDCSHMETWPDLFISDKTYVPLDWDLDDLESVIGLLLDNPGLCGEIADNGQTMYRESISDKGMQEFCDHFINRIAA